MGIDSVAQRRLGRAVLPTAALLASWLLYPDALFAQQALTVDEVRACLCEDQLLSVLRQRNATAKARFDELTQRDNAMSQQIDQLQNSVIQGDLAAQDQLRELIDRRTQISQDRRVALSAWQAAAQNLNATVQDYNAKCTTRPMFQGDVDQAKQNLTCPPAP
jgi:hypothetical protein